MGGGGGGAGNSRELDQTPTWAVASVCGVIILISILIEKALHLIGEWFTERKKKALFEALEKVKAELMVLGFISLLLTFGQSYISRICIPERAADTMLPCALSPQTIASETGRSHQLAQGGEAHHQTPNKIPEHPGGGGGGEAHQPNSNDTPEHPSGRGEAHNPNPSKIPEQPGDGSEHHRRLLWAAMMDMSLKRRVLSGGGGDSACPKVGKGVTCFNKWAASAAHLHFFLAVFHVMYSAITMTLGRAKIRGWKEWEPDTATNNDLYNDPSRFRLSHETSFVRQHTSFWNKLPVSFYLVSFFRQFFYSVRKADYLAMRHGFISVHLTPGSKFDFRNYIKRSLEDDFKVVVGISPALWASAVIFLLLNVNGWKTMFWISVTPMIIILAVGTKLQAIITTMALEIIERHAVIQGMPLVQLNDSHFWFGRPHLVLFLIHFTLFQNAFQIIYFLWIWYEFGLHSCFQENIHVIIIRMCLGVAVQFLCSYITLPLYALVSQMGSQMKRSIFDEQTSKALRKWHQQAKKKQPKGSSPNRSPDGSPRGSPPASSTPVQRLKATGIAALNQTPSRRRHSTEAAELELHGIDSSNATLISFSHTDLLTGSMEHMVPIGEQNTSKSPKQQNPLIQI